MLQPLRLRLLLKVDDSSLRIDLEDTERGCLFRRNRNDPDRRVRSLINVSGEKLPVVHAVELVARKDERILVGIVPEMMKALPNSVGSSLEPFGAIVGLFRG